MISVTEIILIVVGILAIILGYLLPNGQSFSEEEGAITRDKIDELVRKAVQNSQGQIDDMLDECMEDAINKAERAMDRVTNEKMSAISEYSDTVMNDIHRNHDEVMFMYDMLNDKHKNLKNTVSEVNRAAKEVKQTAVEAVITAEQAEATARSAKAAAKEARHIEPEYQEPRKVIPQYEETRQITPQYEEVRQVTPQYEETRQITPQYEEPAQVTQQYQEPVQPQYNVVTPEPEAYVEQESSIDYLDDDYEDTTAVDGSTESEFSSLSDILSKADNAAAVKTQGRIIGSETAYEESAYIENDSSSTDIQPEAEAVFEVPEESEGAKVVSINDVPRKKADFDAAEAASSDNSDPASRNQRILDMHKSGKSAVVIARELRLGIGEVKLVIDLAGKHKKSRSSII